MRGERKMECRRREGSRVEIEVGRGGDREREERDEGERK